MHVSIVFFTMLSIWGNHTFSRSKAFVFWIPRWASWAISTALCRKLCGTTMRVPRKISPWEEIESSSFTCLYSLTTGESHLLSLIAARRPFNVGSSFVALTISSSVIALGILESTMKFMYVSVIFSWVRTLLAVGCRDK